ncbi:putative nudix hydrolase [Mycobacterium xenopi 3993]|nr:putative nudix hydrolase [Mycobacterium xenopi 3993]
MGSRAARIRRGNRPEAARGSADRSRCAEATRRQSGDRVRGAGDLDITAARSNTFQLEWPPGSGTLREFPEVDRVGWFPVAQARTRLLKGQRLFLDRLMAQPSLARLREDH